MNNKHLDNLLADIRAKRTDKELRRHFMEGTMDDAFRDIGLAARPGLADEPKHLAVWLGFELSVASKFTEGYGWL